MPLSFNDFATFARDCKEAQTSHSMLLRKKDNGMQASQQPLLGPRLKPRYIYASRAVVVASAQAGDLGGLRQAVPREAGGGIELVQMDEYV